MNFIDIGGRNAISSGAIGAGLVGGAGVAIGLVWIGAPPPVVGAGFVFGFIVGYGIQSGADLPSNPICNSGFASCPPPKPDNNKCP